jgi:Uma2 family endonuclease
MAVKEPTLTQQAPHPEWGPYRFSLEQYHKMGEAGIFPPDIKVELIDGEIIPMSIGKDHAAIVNRLNKKLVRGLAEDSATITIQNPLTISDDSEPLPDVLVLKYREDDYQQHLPQPEDVLVVIEVADSTLRYDQQAKVPKYARFKIPETWVVDVNGERIWVYQQPGQDAYLHIQAFERGSQVKVFDLQLSVDEILGQSSPTSEASE